MACLSVLFISLLNRQLKHVRFGCGLVSSCELIPKFCSNGPPLHKAWWSTPVFYRYIQQFHININSNWTFKRNVKKKKCFSKCKRNALEKSYLITTAFVFSVKVGWRRTLAWREQIEVDEANFDIFQDASALHLSVVSTSSYTHVNLCGRLLSVLSNVRLLYDKLSRSKKCRILVKNLEVR